MPRKRIPRCPPSSSSTACQPSSSLLYRQDIVERDGQVGVVLRTWHEEADHLAETGTLPHHHHDDLDRPLRKGEVGVMWRKSSDRAIVASSQLQLVDRLLMIGDIVKRSLTSPQSGVIIDAESTVKLSRSSLSPPTSPADQDRDSLLLTDVPARDLIQVRRYSPGSHVIYDDWIGVIEEVIIEHTWASVALDSRGNHTIYHTYDTISDYATGKREHAPWRAGDGYIRLTHPANPPTSDIAHLTDWVLVDAEHRGAWVNWLAVNQKLPAKDQDAKAKPSGYWSEDIGNLVLARTSPDGAALVGDIAVFRRNEDLRASLAAAYGAEEAEQRWQRLHDDSRRADGVMGRPGRDNPSWDFEVVSSTLDVTVKWQDGSVTHEPATSMLPVATMIDPHDTYPGELVTWRSTGGEQVTQQQLVVVHSFDSDERTAVVAPYTDAPAASSSSSSSSSSSTPSSPSATASRQEVPALELDVYGEEPGEEAIWQHGIHRGEIVLIGRRPNDGIELPRIPRLGAPVEPHFNWVDDFERTTQAFLDQHRTPFSAPFLYPRLSVDLPKEESAKLDWIGVVVDLDERGHARILLPDGETVVTVPPTQLSKLEDFYNEENAPLDGDDPMLGGLHGAFGGPLFDAEARWQTEDGQEVEDDEMGDWEDDASDDEAASTSNGAAAPVPATTEQTKPCDTSTAPPPQAQPPPPTPAQQAAPAPAAPASQPTPSTSTSAPTRPHVYRLPSSTRPTPTNPSWSSFELLDSAPVDHHYLSTPPPATDRTFLTRLNREHKSLRSALPTNIVVRTYSDRLDLLRVLIFGSQGTPYADGAFLFDVHLDEFPRHPPKVFFHSWTDGRGRASPNLYEDGKVCLSLLGTWSGEHSSESWQPAKSSLLQLFVSIASLVLVAEPYYTEPAFERLKGTQEGRVNARLFNESAYVATMGFVKRALSGPPVSGFEAVLREYYYGEGSRRIDVLVEDARALLDISREVREQKKRKRSEGGDDDDAPAGVEIEGTSMEPLSGGAAIVLERALKGLEALREEGKSSMAG